MIPLNNDRQMTRKVKNKITYFRKGSKGRRPIFNLNMLSLKTFKLIKRITKAACLGPPDIYLVFLCARASRAHGQSEILLVWIIFSKRPHIENGLLYFAWNVASDHHIKKRYSNITIPISTLFASRLFFFFFFS